MFFLTIGHNTVFSTIGSSVMYFGLLILLMYILKQLIEKNDYVIGKSFISFILLFMLLTVGVSLQQELTIYQKISPLIASALMLIFYLYGYKLITNPRDVRMCGYTIFISFILSMLVSPLLGEKIIMEPSEGMSYALTAGLGHKNASSICILTAFMAISAYFKFVVKKRIDFIVLTFITILIVAGASRSSWLLMMIYIMFINIDIIKKIKRNSRWIFYIILFLLVSAIGGMFLLIMIDKSASYGVRLLGVYSYFYQYGNDIYAILFGKGNILYNDRYGDYNSRYWTLLGGVGSFEIGYLEVMAKNGLFGLIAYTYMYIKPIISSMKNKNITVKIMLLSLSITALISCFVEEFITQIIYPYTIFTLCTLSYLNNKCK